MCSEPRQKKATSWVGSAAGACWGSGARARARRTEAHRLPDKDGLKENRSGDKEGTLQRDLRRRRANNDDVKPSIRRAIEEKRWQMMAWVRRGKLCAIHCAYASLTWTSKCSVHGAVLAGHDSNADG